MKIETVAEKDDKGNEGKKIDNETLIYSESCNEQAVISEISSQSSNSKDNKDRKWIIN